MSRHNTQPSHHHVRPEEPVLTPAAQPTTSRPLSAEKIAQRAYENFMARGGTHGDDQQDWMAAERELTAEQVKKA